MLPHGRIHRYSLRSHPFSRRGAARDSRLAGDGESPLHGFHSMRHFFASGLIAEGCDVVTVQRALGHAKATTTLSTYSHLGPSAEDRTRIAAGNLMQSALDDRSRLHDREEA